MRTKVASLLFAICVAGVSAPGIAQQPVNDTGTLTETQERRAEGQDNDAPWDLLGLLGLAGLLGLRRKNNHTHNNH